MAIKGAGENKGLVSIYTKIRTLQNFVIGSLRTIRNCRQINAFWIVRKLTMTDAVVIAGNQWGKPPCACPIAN
jgi:hypothetical protein